MSSSKKKNVVELFDNKPEDAARWPYLHVMGIKLPENPTEEQLIGLNKLENKLEDHKFREEFSKFMIDTIKPILMKKT